MTQDKLSPKYSGRFKENDHENDNTHQTKNKTILSINYHRTDGTKCH